MSTPSYALCFPAFCGSQGSLPMLLRSSSVTSHSMPRDGRIPWPALCWARPNPVEFQPGTLFRGVQTQPRVHRLYHSNRRCQRTRARLGVSRSSHAPDLGRHYPRLAYRPRTSICYRTRGPRLYRPEPARRGGRAAIRAYACSQPRHITGDGPLGRANVRV